MDAAITQYPMADAEGVILDTRTGERGTIAQWVEGFAEVWAEPSARLERLLGLLSPDVVLKAPTRPPQSVGRAAARAAFRRAFRAMPDLHGVVHRWAARSGVLFVEMTFHATIGGRAAHWDNVDRVIFKNGEAVEHIAYFDSAKVRAAFTRNPAAMIQLLRLRLGV